MNGSTKSLDALTGLRFVAALAVFIHHVSGKFGISKIEWPLGAQAVSFFFVLSGFILTYVYHDRLKWSGVTKFYFTRWARIWPLHAVCLAISVFLFGNHLVRNPDFYGQLITTSLLLQSWVPNSSWVFAINGVSWSISTEMFFYLMFPLFLLGGQRQFWFKYLGLLGLIVVLVPSITMISHTNIFANVDYYRLGHTNPLLRLPEFCTGMAVGFIFLNRAKLQVDQVKPNTSARVIFRDTSIELMCIIAIVGYQGLAKYFRIAGHLRVAEWAGPFPAGWFNFTSGCLVFAFVIYVFSKSKGLIAKFMGLKPMVFLGEVSFAFYMIHELVIRAARSYSTFYGGLSPVMVAVCIACISLSLSILLFKLVEMPSKSSLLAIFDGKFKSSLKIPMMATWRFSTSSLGLVALLLLLVPMFTLADNVETQAAPEQVAAIFQATSTEDRNVKFGDSLALLGHAVVPKAGGLEIQLAWQKNSRVDRARFVHVCDKDGKIVAHGPRESSLFRNAKIGSRFVDTIYLVNDSLKDGCSIGIGLHGKGIGMAPISKGPRSLKNRRLDLISPAKYAQLARIRQEKFGVRVSGSNAETRR